MIIINYDSDLKIGITKNSNLIIKDKSSDLIFKADVGCLGGGSLKFYDKKEKILAISQGGLKYWHIECNNIIIKKIYNKLFEIFLSKTNKHKYYVVLNGEAVDVSSNPCKYYEKSRLDRIKYKLWGRLDRLDNYKEIIDDIFNRINPTLKEFKVIFTDEEFNYLTSDDNDNQKNNELLQKILSFPLKEKTIPESNDKKIDTENAETSDGLKEMVSLYAEERKITDEDLLNDIFDEFQEEWFNNFEKFKNIIEDTNKIFLYFDGIRDKPLKEQKKFEEKFGQEIIIFNNQTEENEKYCYSLEEFHDKFPYHHQLIFNFYTSKKMTKIKLLLKKFIDFYENLKIVINAVKQEEN